MGMEDGELSSLKADIERLYNILWKTGIKRKGTDYDKSLNKDDYENFDTNKNDNIKYINIGDHSKDYKRWW